MCEGSFNDQGKEHGGNPEAVQHRQRLHTGRRSTGPRGESLVRGCLSSFGVVLHHASAEVETTLGTLHSGDLGVVLCLCTGRHFGRATVDWTVHDPVSQILALLWKK